MPAHPRPLALRRNPMRNPMHAPQQSCVHVRSAASAYSALGGGLTQVEEVAEDLFAGKEEKGIVMAGNCRDKDFAWGGDANTGAAWRHGGSGVITVMI